MKLTKSKETRENEKARRHKDRANKFYINEEEESDHSTSEVSSEDDSARGDSDLEDLMQLEQMEVAIKKKMQDSRRRTSINKDDYGGMLELDEEFTGYFDDLDASLQNQTMIKAGMKQGASRLEAIQHLIKRKRQLRKREMKATVSNEFINQFLITSLINKQWIKDKLEKEYTQELNQELDQINDVKMFD